MQLVDTHCHIQGSTSLAAGGAEVVTREMWAKAGYPSGDELIAKAQKYGVQQMICVGCSLSDSQLAVGFVKSRENCYASIGIHPHEAKDYVSNDEQGSLQMDSDKATAFAALIAAPKVVAIGECGLDYFYEHSDPASQAVVLEFQIELALANDLPIIFHVREAFDDFWPIFDSCIPASSKIRGVLHSFTDSVRQMEKAVSYGLYLGVNGIATFTKDQSQLDMYKSIPLSSLLLETDSPFLTPSPYRGTICEPYHTSVTAEFLAHVRNSSLQDLAAATSENARTLFNLPQGNNESS